MKATRGRSQNGFSMPEVIIVLVIMGIMAAISLPGIMGYIRSYRLNVGIQQVTSQLQTARQRAVMKNVNIGAMWAATDGQSSSWVVEDDLRPKFGIDWFRQADWNVLIADKTQSGGVLRLPTGIRFDDPQNCGANGAGNRWGIRFNSLGAACSLPDATCGGNPANAPAPAPLPVFAENGAMTICLLSNTGLRRSITIGPGGRVMSDQGFKKP